MTKEEAYLYEHEVEQNATMEINVDKWRYHAKRVGNAVAGKMAVYTVEAKNISKDKNISTIKKMQVNRKLVAKAISLIMLHNMFKVILFHWICWRWIHWFMPTWKMKAIYDAVLNKANTECTDFFQCVSFLQANNIIQETMATETIQTILQKQNSVADTTRL